MADERHTIRGAAVADASAIAEVHVHAWRRAYEGMMPREYLESLSVEKRAAVWEKLLDGGTTLVAQMQGKIVGFCSVGPARDDDLDDTNDGEMYALYVEPNSWGSGIGTALCAAGLAALKDAGFVRATVWVLAANAAGRGFYEKYGFSTDGHEEPYRVGEIELRSLRYVIAP